MKLLSTTKKDSKLAFNRLIVPVDFSEYSKGAIRVAVSLAREWKAVITLVHIVPNLLGGRFLPNTQLKKLARVRLEKLRKEMVGSQLTSKIMVETGSPFDGIAKIGGHSKSNLIIIPTHGHTGFKHAFLGSTAERVIRYAKCPVLVIRGSTLEKPAFELRFRRILAPVDFSRFSDKTLKAAIDLAKAHRGKLFIVHVVQIPLYHNYPHPSLISQEKSMVKDAEEELELLLSKLSRDREVISDKVLRSGDAFQEILKEAEEKNVNLIMMTTKGSTGLEHVVLGSTCEKVVRYAKCPVLVMR
jgi:nucleotide-binding universal stress UspA family protein